MRKRVERLLFLSTALLVVSGFLALATSRSYGAPVVVLGIALVLIDPFAALLDVKYRAYRILTNTFTVVVAVYLFYLLLFFSVVDVVTWLVIYIQCYKLLHRKAARDYYQIFLMAFFMLVCACALDAEAAIGAVMALFIAGAVWAFIMLQVHIESEANAADTVADILPLQMETSSPNGKRPSLLNTGFVLSVTALCAACIVTATGIFLFTPRMQAGVFGRTNFVPPTQQRTGLSDSVNLAHSGRVVEDNSPVMLVEFPDEPEGKYNGPLYWRSSSFDRYTGGATWESYGISGSVQDKFPKVGFLSQSPFVVSRTAARPGRVVRQTIYLDKIEANGLPALPLVREIRCSEARLDWDVRNNFAVRVTRTKSANLQYEALSEVQEPTPRQLRRAPRNYAEVFPWRDYARLTNHGLLPRTVQLARQVTQGADNAYDQAVAIRDWLERGELSYTLDLPPLPSSHPVDAFIHETQRGHCQLFASAMALMLRSLEIPTRVVSGYRGGEWNPGDGAFVVRNSMAHLWLEVYFIDYGWVTFDPSPPPEPLPGGVDAVARMMSRLMLRGKMMWYRDIVGYDGAFNWFQLRNLALAVISFDGELFQRAIKGSSLAASKMPLRLVLGGILIALLTAMALQWRTRERPVAMRRKAKLTRDQLRALRLLRFLKRRLHRYGLVPRGATAGDVLQEVQRNPIFPAEPVEQVVGVYNRVRFGARSLPPTDYRRLRKLIRKLRRAPRTAP